jgi:hypothetical protein
MSQRSSRVTSILLLILFLLASANSLRADVTGSILGIVHDRTQAVVAGARIVATNVQTNYKQETVSAADGSFRILALPAGVYKLTVTAPGFGTFTETDIQVKVNDQLRFDVALNVGSVQEKVEIVANAVQVQTESSQLGDVIDSKKMLALPLNGRSYIDLLGLQAGVAPATAETIQQDRPVSGGMNPGNISVNGQRETANAFLVNGGDVSEGRNLGAGLVPNLDSIEEFRLITNSFDAEYGKFSGAVINAITKSGTNKFHGAVFEFLRNDKLDAKNYFFGSKSELRRNQFGYAVGGPFWKNKLFWFTDYQGTREVRGAETFAFLPTADQRQGNFDPATLSLTVDGPLTGTGGAQSWAQVLSQRLGYPVVPGEAYSFSGCSSNNPVTGCVFPVDPVSGLAHIPGPTDPNNAWSVVAVKTFSYIPAPNIDPAVGSYSDNSQKNRVSDNKYGQRVDFNNQTTGNWSWYYHYDYSSVFNSLPAASVPGFPSLTLIRAQQFVMSNTKNLGATAVNEARITIFRNRLNKDNPKGSFAKLSDLGFNNANGLGIIPSTTPGYPEFMPQMYFNNFFVGVPTLNTFQPNTTYTVSDGFSKAMGRHTWKFGGEFRYLQVNERNYASPNGNFVFDGSVAGLDFADYLLGAPADVNGYTQAALQLLDSRTRYGGAYVQDSWKVKPNLTLNLGLRWEVSMPWYDTQGKIQAIVPGLQSTVFPLSPPGLNFPGDPGIPKTIAPTKYNNFGPRLGLAYSPGFSEGALGKIFGGPGKTSIRAAFGLFYTSIEDLNLFYEVADAPFGLYWSTPLPVMLDEPFRLRTSGQSLGQRFPFTIPTPGAASNKTLDFSIYEPFTYYPGYDIHNKLPYAEHFNLSIQRQLSKSTVMTLAYVGTEGHHLITSVEANPGDPALCMRLAAEGCGPYAENQVFQLPTATGSCQTGTSTPNPQCVYSTRQTILNPNYCPGNVTLVCFGYGNTYTRLNANSIYNAGQITVERKANDVTFLAAYTFARGLDNSSAFGDYLNFSNAKLSRGLSSTDITHNFVASYIWAIPFDRAFKKAPKRLTQGWQIQGITRLATGFPIQLSQGNGDVSLTGSPSGDMPNLIGKVVTFDPRKATPGCPTNVTNDGTGCYFLPPLATQDPSQCGVPGGPPESQPPSGGAFNYNCAFGTFGTANRRFFHGPGFNNTDFGLTKRTNIREGMGFELRLEFFNIFNHAQFINPNGNISDYQSFGIITSARDPRIGQVSARFIW